METTQVKADNGWHNQVKILTQQPLYKKVAGTELLVSKSYDKNYRLFTKNKVRFI